MRLWSDAVTGAAIGKTAGTYDAIGTVTLKIGARHLLGFEVLIASSTPTSGENGMGILRVDSKDLGISQEEIVLGYAATDGIATNDKEAPVEKQFYPFKSPDPSRSLDNAKIDFSLTCPVSNTGGFDIAVSAIFSDELPDMEFFVELMAGLPGRATGGAQAQMDAGVKAATATAFTTGIQITSQGKTLIGLLGVANQNAPTAGEASVGVVEYQASQINDFSPQKWVMGFGYDAGIGTPVGTPVSASRRNGFYAPTRFPLPETNFEMSVSMLFATALTNELDGVAAALWKND